MEVGEFGRGEGKGIGERGHDFVWWAGEIK
jgi:hypothetical protein